MILLVTGSRDWPVPDKRDIFNHLHRWYGNNSQFWNGPVVVRHGGARGPDTWASEWVAEAQQILGEDFMHLIQEDPHPVSREAWRANPYRAGKVRNLEMIHMDPPPDYVIAFSYANSGGTSHCWNAAHVEAQIPGLFISWEVLHGGYPDNAGRGGVVAAGARAEQPAPASGGAAGDGLF